MAFLARRLHSPMNARVKLEIVSRKFLLDLSLLFEQAFASLIVEIFDNGINVNVGAVSGHIHRVHGRHLGEMQAYRRAPIPGTSGFRLWRFLRLWLLGYRLGHTFPLV